MEVYAKFGGPTKDIAEGIKICKQLVWPYEGQIPHYKCMQTATWHHTIFFWISKVHSNNTVHKYHECFALKVMAKVLTDEGHDQIIFGNANR